MQVNTPIHTGIMSKGKFIPDNAAFLFADFEGFEGKRIGITIKELRRTDEFNRYYWAAIVKTFTDFFNQEKSFGRLVNSEFVHEILAGKFLGFSQQVLPGGEIVMMRNKSRTLTTKEFWDYVMFCKSWGEEFFNLTFPEKEKTEA